jgi:hypothetical protein
MYKVGDKPDGIYLIKEGSFEMSRPSLVAKQTTDRLQAMNIDPIAKLQLKRQLQVQADSSMQNVKVSILGKG